MTTIVQNGCFTAVERVQTARQMVKSTLLETYRTEPSPIEALTPPVVSTAGTHNGMLARSVGNRAASAAVNGPPVRWRDVVVHRARIKGEGPTVGEVDTL